MMDVEKQVAFWRAGALEDWTVAQELVQNGRHRHGLFFAHLSLEKLLKACVVRQSGDLAPRLHNLVRLAQLTSLSLTEAQIDTLAELNAFNLEGRYPDSFAIAPNRAEADLILARSGEVFRWLMSRF